MKTVGTITFHRTINYGALLQAFALQKVLIDKGYVPEIIDYCNPLMGMPSLSTFRKLKYFLWHDIVKKALVGMDRPRKTEKFCREHLRISTRKYFDAETLHSDPPNYDAYITGSDQVWNPIINNNDSSSFLTFAPAGKLRISYAASFGVSQIQDRFTDGYINWLNKIHFLSTRELEGKKIIEQLTGRIADVTLDPTLLLDKDQWNQIAVPYKSTKQYILCYYMPGDKEVNKSITTLANQISELTGWRILCIGQKEYMRLNFLKSSVFGAGPAEYLGLFQNASFIVTNSFHGTAFSINYRKPFLVPINQKIPPEKALNSRITTLLKTLNLEQRLLPIDESYPIKNTIGLDYQVAEELLDCEKKKSIDFLINSLSGA